MQAVVGIRFSKCGKIYDFKNEDLDLKKGDLVVVESELGISIGSVVAEKPSENETKRELKKILRKVTDADLKEKEENRALEEEAFGFAAERIMARGLPMKLVSTETTLDRKRITFYFVAEKRIDFRELVKDLAQKFKTRIELRQIGVRDEAKLLGGIGVCGRRLCCRTFLTSFEPISIRMAKKQDLVLNASKLSGICGRLMCCLGYEYNIEGGSITPESEGGSITPESEGGSITPESEGGSVTPGSMTPSVTPSMTPMSEGSMTPSVAPSMTPMSEGSVTPESVTPESEGSMTPSSPSDAQKKGGWPHRHRRRFWRRHKKKKSDK